MPRKTTNATAEEDWQPCIFLRVEPDKRTIHMRFTHAPTVFNISSYIVSLASDGSGTDVEERTNMTSFDFTNVIPAEYNVLVVPLSNYSYEDCKVCKRTYTKGFRVNPTNTTIFELIGKHCDNEDTMRVKPPLPEKNKNKDSTKQSFNLPVILITSLLFLIFFSIISWFVIKYRRNSISRKKSVMNNDSQPGPEEKDKIKVYVINTFDHEQHQRACESFMVYLHEHCFCEVLNLNENIKMMTDLTDILNSVKFIILIHSEGFSNQVNAWKEKILYPELCKSNPSILLQVMNNTITNCIDCAMNYTNPNYLVTNNNCKQLFVIPDNMTELVCYLHNINMKFTDEENIPLIEEHIYSSDDGLEMTNAIDRATEYELLHDDWFLRLHPYSFTI